MSRKSKTIISAFCFGLIATIWLCVGAYRDREWQELGFLIKYRPSAKVFFYSPQGETTQSNVPGHEGYLTAEQQREEQAYVEFVERK